MPSTSTGGDAFKRQPRGAGSSLVTVTGYVTETPSDNRGGSDDEDEDDEDDNWLDYSQMRDAFSSGTFVSKMKSRFCRVGLRDYNNKKHACFGRFPLTDPWWDITVNKDKKNRVHGPILYALRTDADGIRQHNLVPILFTKAAKQASKEDSEELISKFEDFVRRTGQHDRLTFDCMESLLHQFHRQLEHESMEQKLVSSMLTSELVQSVLRAHSHPALLTFLCHLFPTSSVPKFISCLISPPRRHLDNLQKAAEEEPWVFGFSKILFKRFRLCGVEASLQAFDTAQMLEKFPDIPKDALYIYEVLKQDASRDGHTFISFRDLQCHRLWEALAYSVTDWQAALGFLSSNQVTKEERFDSRKNIFLFHNWKAEVDIADGLEEVINRGLEEEAPIWKIDFSSPELERLRGDADQWNAAQKVASSPVTILSGKGGCGKTTVVTEIIRLVCQQTPLAPNETEDDSEILSPIFTKEEPEKSDDGIANGTVGQNSHTETDASQDFLAELSSSQLSEMSPQLLSKLTDYVIASHQPHRADSKYSRNERETKESRLYSDLCADLIKYLATGRDTALSGTSMGSKILLTAPTGKAAKLLGHKACMKSCTLHHVIFSYRAFVKAQALKRRQQAADHKKQESGRDTDKSAKCGGDAGNADGAGKGSEGGGQDQNESSSGMEDDEAKWKFADTQVLVVDECSLVSLRLFATLLNILVANSQLKKIILLGDVRQLPSIDPGNFLCDVFTVFKEKGQSVELMTNHRSESELIISNATRISQRQLPLFDPTHNFHFRSLQDSNYCADPDRDAEIRQLLASRPELMSHESSQFVAFRRMHCEAINELCCQHYNQHTIRKAEGRGGKQPYDFCVGDKICLKKNGQVMNHGTKLRSCIPHEVLEALGIQHQPQKSNMKEVKMNAATAAEKVTEDGAVDETRAEMSGESVPSQAASYSVHNTDVGVKMENLSQDASTTDQLESPNFTHPHMNADVKREQWSDDAGDCGANDSHADGDSTQPASQEVTDEDERQEKMTQGAVRLCNGEIFFIMHEEEEGDPESNKLRRFLYLSDRDPVCPRVYCCTLAQLKRECHIRHAWARTIHTYQGSESDTVVYFVGEPVNQNWKHVYTAVTRGRKAVFIVGKESNLREAVWKKDRLRRSRLTRRLYDMLKAVDMQKLHAWVREVNEEAKVALLKQPASFLHSRAFRSTPKSTSLSATQPATQTSCFSGPPAPPSNHVHLDSFPDSDDSWVHGLSPLLASDIGAGDSPRPAAIVSEHQLACGSASGAIGAASEGPSSASCSKSFDTELVLKSPCKRQQSQEAVDLTPTKRTCPDPIDSIVSPVRRNLNI